MKPAAIGMRARSGWATLVAVTEPVQSPSVIDRRRLELVETFTYEFRQPYHTAEKLELKAAEKFISHCRDEAQRLASQGLQAIRKDLQKKGYEVARCGLLLASGRPLPNLEQALASHAMIHTADGELFRNALAHASQRFGLDVRMVKEREIYDCAAKELRVKAADLKRRIAELGKPLGPPWSQDEKLSALVAWLALTFAAAPPE